MPKAQNVSTGKPAIGGAIHRAPLGTPLPTSVDDVLDAAFLDMGFVSEDGVTNSNTRSSESIKAWGGTTVLTSQTEYADNFQMVFIEAKNPNVLKTVFGDGNVSGDIDSGITVKANAGELDRASYVIDTILNGAKKRIVLPDAGISEVGDVVYVDNDVIGYDVTLAAMPDEAENTHYEYIKTDTSQIRYTVAFNSDGGSAVASQRVLNGKTATQPANPTKNGFNFVEWQHDGTAYNFSTPVTADITLTAVWEAAPVMHAVTQNLTGATSDFSEDKIADGTRLEITLTPESGTVDTVEVTMGGTDITNDAWDDTESKVTIASVTGDVVITALAQ